MLASMLWWCQPYNGHSALNIRYNLAVFLLLHTQHQFWNTSGLQTDCHCSQHADQWLVVPCMFQKHQQQLQIAAALLAL